MPNPQVLITNRLHHHGTPPVATLVHAGERLGRLRHSQWLQSRDRMHPGIPRSALRVRMRCSSSAVEGRKYDGPNSFTIKRINLRTDKAIAEAESRTYSSVLFGAFPWAMTRNAATTF